MLPPISLPPGMFRESNGSEPHRRPVNIGPPRPKNRYDNISNEWNFANNILACSARWSTLPPLSTTRIAVHRACREERAPSAPSKPPTTTTSPAPRWRHLADNGTVNESSWNAVNAGQNRRGQMGDQPRCACKCWTGMDHGSSTAFDAKNSSDVLTLAMSPGWWTPHKRGSPHVEGVDPPTGTTRTMLPNKPNNGMYRHEPSTVTACVLDADYKIDAPLPTFIASRVLLERNLPAPIGSESGGLLPASSTLPSVPHYRMSICR